MYNWKIIGDKIFGILKGSGFFIKMFDKSGNQTVDPHESIRFYATKDPHNVENDEYSILVSVHDENARSHIDFKTINLDSDLDFEETLKIKKSLDTSIGDREGIKINWYKFDQAMKPQDKPITESKDISKAAGTSKSTYQKVGSGRIILRHSGPVDETKQGSRWRNVKAIFVENKLGERFLYPHMHPSGARAMARHFTNDGKMSDEIGVAIQNLSGDYMALKVSARMLESAGHHSTAEAVREAMRSVNKKVRRLSGPRGYSMLSKELGKPILIDEAAVQHFHRDMLERCGCGDDQDKASKLLVAARYLKEADVVVDDGMKFLSAPDITSKASQFSNQKSRLAWQVSQLANSLAAGSTKDRLMAISADLEDGRILDQEEMELIRKAFMAYRHDSATPFEPSDPELDRVRHLSGL